MKNGKQYGERLVIKNPKAKRLINRIGTKFFLTDHNKSLLFLGYKGFKIISTYEDDCDVKISSDALNYMLINEWGGMTCQGNARYFYTNYGDIYKFHLLMNIGELNNQGQEFDWKRPSFTELIKTHLQKNIQNITQWINNASA
jgi:hypothetical protein